MTLCAFIFLGVSFVSLWACREPKIWGSFLGFSLLFGFASGNIKWVGFVFIGILLSLWIFYHRKPSFSLFAALICFSAILKMRLLPGYTPFFFTPKFAVGLEGPLIGLFPLAFLYTNTPMTQSKTDALSCPVTVPLARSIKDWTAVLKGVLLGCAGIAILAILAVCSGVVEWHFKLPAFVAARTLSNFFLTSIPEEGFYRGFIQTVFCKYFETLKFGKTLALVLTAVLFTAAHIYWSPNLAILVFVFLAGLLYGAVYLISGKIESSIFCHFLLNFVHITFFSF